MTNRTCSVADCDRPYRCSGYCGLHYDRVRRYGSPHLLERPEKVCGVDGCGRKFYANGLCAAHDKRRAAHGDPQAHIPLRQIPTADERGDVVGRIMRRVTHDDSGCLTWIGPTNDAGYASIVWGGRTWLIHRAMWTAQVAPIPDGDWTIDHLCRNRACVNVQHMEVVTRTENAERGGGRFIAYANRAAAETCKRGHAWTPDNIKFNKDGRRHCRTCARERKRAKSDEVNARRRERYAANRAAGVPWREAWRAQPAS